LLTGVSCWIIRVRFRSDLVCIFRRHGVGYGRIPNVTCRGELLSSISPVKIFISLSRHYTLRVFKIIRRFLPSYVPWMPCDAPQAARVNATQPLKLKQPRSAFHGPRGSLQISISTQRRRLKSKPPDLAPSTQNATPSALLLRRSRAHFHPKNPASTATPQDPSSQELKQETPHASTTRAAQRTKESLSLVKQAGVRVRNLENQSQLPFSCPTLLEPRAQSQLHETSRLLPRPQSSFPSAGEANTPTRWEASSRR